MLEVIKSVAEFIAGNDQTTKQAVADILKSFGWRQIYDLGDISAARGTEQMMPFWLRMWCVLGHANFNYAIAVGDKPKEKTG